MTSSATTSVSRRRPIDDHYLALIKRFPLRPLRSRQEHSAAGAILDELVGRNNLPTGERDYLEALVHFVSEYEARITEDRLRKLKPVEILKELLAMNNMNTNDLGYVLGARGLASEVLNGKRGLSKSIIAKLARRFMVSPSLFLEAEEIA